MMDLKITGLIAIGASVSANCQSCLEYHLDKALEAGAEAEEIMHAVKVGNSVKNGAKISMNKFVKKLMDTKSVAAKETKQGCGCSG